jgi:glycerol-3-phosphate O-acyltransferase/dihydroxyacetone phosphate acyltransferase
MLYETLRAAARVALHWYYGDVVVQGRDRIPAAGPLLVVANHPNALVDAMLVATTFRRRVLITAKATLFEHAFLGPFLNRVGVVPLQRAQDVRAAAKSGSSISRNDAARSRVTGAFDQDGVVLIFPEGISHDQPALAPLRTGAARMALHARQTGTHSLHVLPVGLVFEEKERPRSRVLVRIGDPIDLDTWCLAHPTANAAALTKEIDARLRRVTLNFATAERARRAVRIARALAAITNGSPILSTPSTFESEAAIAARVEAATEALEHSSPALGSVADAFAARLELLEARLAERGADLTEARVSLRLHHGARFVAREGLLIAFALPIAAVGRVTHVPPIWAARLLAMRSLRTDPSRDQPAMRTMVLGLIAVVAWYALQALALTLWFGGAATSLWLVTIFLAANVDLQLHDRLTRVRQRARTFVALRADPAFRASVLEEIDSLLEEAYSLERALMQSGLPESPP